MGGVYPFVPSTPSKRRSTPLELTRLFVCDGFLDRYSGERLLFPGTLRLLSTLLPTEVPFHTNWKTSACHPAYWDLYPTLDHVHPIARGGTDTPDNWVTTSMRKNAAKANWTLAELGWELQPAGNVEEWDGLMRWFVEYTNAHPEMLVNGYLKTWRAAAVATRSSAAGPT